MIECPCCDGEGFVGERPYEVLACPECDGAGEISREQALVRLARIADALYGLEMVEVLA